MSASSRYSFKCMVLSNHQALTEWCHSQPEKKEILKPWNSWSREEYLYKINFGYLIIAYGYNTKREIRQKKILTISTLWIILIDLVRTSFPFLSIFVVPLQKYWILQISFVFKHFYNVTLGFRKPFVAMQYFSTLFTSHSIMYI